jgi:hypothetical protein
MNAQAAGAQHLSSRKTYRLAISLRFIFRIMKELVNYKTSLAVSQDYSIIFRGVSRIFDESVF